MFNLLKLINEQANLILEKKKEEKGSKISKDQAAAVYHRDYKKTSHKPYRQNQ